MTGIDFIAIALIVLYGALGYFTGVIRRMIGLVALYAAFVAATNMGIQAGSILQQSSAVATPDSRIFAFFGIIFAVLLIIDGGAQLVHGQLQLQAIVFNRVSGVIIGLLTALVLSVLITFELQGAANPTGGAQLDSLQQNIRDAVNGSHVAVPLERAIGRPIVSIFVPVLPANPEIYFGPGVVNP